ncbi:DUF1775 domain-containing protein [Devosia sediminis]|uniref:DUF1775 domain-containing protein n=1 Tax=Devosia sediminis TaxID=2798801 RepID=A0A934IQ03_9HYPH|nr:DUF1775 domain-containing protein [Devosia sediminis]MBJ3784703.1 DUF1775 domain-containing protein [Devosia sediminis]
MPSQISLAALLLLLAGTGVAHAHATAGGASAGAGQPFTLLLTVPHGCQGQPTTEVVVGIPEGFLVAEGLAVSGWTVSSVTAPLSRPYRLNDQTISEGVIEITWIGGSLPDDETGVFAVQGIFADDMAPGPARFPLLQLCPDGEEAWIDAGGDRPAPFVDVLP